MACGIALLRDLELVVALDLTDLELMKEMRNLAARGSMMTELKDIGLKELENVQHELTTKTGGQDE